MAKNSVYLPAILLLLTLPISTLGLTLGESVPSLSGKSATGSGLLTLRRLQTEITFEKDALGKRVERNGKYIMLASKNLVVLNFFASYCVPCVKEIPAFNRLFRKYQGMSIRFLYVNVDPELDQEKARDFIARHRIEVPMMLPNQRQVIQAFDVTSLPRIIVIDRDNKIRHILTGFDESLEDQLNQMIAKLL